MQGEAEQDQAERGTVEAEQSGAQPERAYGLVLEIRRAAGNTRVFLSARIAQRVVHGAGVTSVPNSNLGMALIGGVVIPVVALGEGNSDFVICEIWDGITQGVEPAPASGATETIAIRGVHVLASGAFERLDSGSVKFRGESVEALDMALLLDALE